MKRQSLLLVVTLTVTSLLVAPSQGAPYHHLVHYNQPLQRHSANVVVVPNNGAGIQQFAASGVPLPVGGQYLLVQPGASPVVYMTRAEGENKPTDPDNSNESGSGGGIIDSFVNFVFGFVPSNPLPSLPGVSGTEAPGDAEKPTETPAGTQKEKPVKVVDSASTGQQSAPLEKFDEDAPVAPAVPAVVPAPGQRFVVIGQPQFFGNYDALRNPVIQQSLGTKGAVSSFLLLKNQQVVPLANAANGKVQEEAANLVASQPGASALDFQRYLNSVKQQPQQDISSVPIGYQNLVYVARQPSQANVDGSDDSASITVDAQKVKPLRAKEGSAEESEGDTEDVEANPPGPSIAQVKPQAIALAGPGGVAAAAPIGTALVGPGGLAVAAPSATAVAGPSGGAPPPPGAHASAALTSPAAYKAYLLEQQARGSYPGSYHVAYSV